MQTGLGVNLGRTVLLDIGRATMVISEAHWEPYDTGCFTHVGINWVNQQYILIKLRQHSRAGFESIAKHIVMVAGPGVWSSDYAQFNFVRLNRPISPLDDSPWY